MSSEIGQGSELPASVEEADQIHRSVKKHKREDARISPPPEDHVMEEHNAWAKPSFDQVLYGKTNTKKAFYTREDEEDILDDLNTTDVI